MNKTLSEVGVEIAAIMEKAADWFKSGRYGWTQGTGLRINDDGSEDRCLMAALDRADISIFGNSSNYQNMYSLLASKFNGSPVRWNDHPNRTKDEVIDLLETTAKDLRNTA